MKLIKYVYKGLRCVIMSYIEDFKLYVEVNYYSFFQMYCLELLHFY